MNPLINDEKHYVTLNNYLRSRFKQKCFRVALDAGYSCPNRDGTLSYGGCDFCSAKRSGDFSGDATLSIGEQFTVQLKKMANKWQNGAIIAYLQAGSNTYAPLDELRTTFEGILALKDQIKIISIATRPDCLSEEILALLSEINQQKELWVELGLQSASDVTKATLNCHYTTNDFIESVKALKKRNIKVIAHIIDGLPNETFQMMIETAKLLNELQVDGVKIHMLHLLKNTNLAKRFTEEPFELLSLNAYRDIVCEQLRYLNDNIVIHRVTGDAPKELLIGPHWTLKKFVVMNEIDKKMRSERIYQGDLAHGN